MVCADEDKVLDSGARRRRTRRRDAWTPAIFLSRFACQRHSENEHNPFTRNRIFPRDLIESIHKRLLIMRTSIVKYPMPFAWRRSCFASVPSVRASCHSNLASLPASNVHELSKLVRPMWLFDAHRPAADRYWTRRLRRCRANGLPCCGMRGCALRLRSRLPYLFLIVVVEALR